MRILTLVAVAACALTVAAVTQSPQEQAPPQRRRSVVPDSFTNLQVLPKDISKNDLMRIMRSFSLTMDKNCSYCHVATDDLSQADFPADDKETKKKTRELLRFILDTQKKSADGAR